MPFVIFKYMKCGTNGNIMRQIERRKTQSKKNNIILIKGYVCDQLQAF